MKDSPQSRGGAEKGKKLKAEVPMFTYALLSEFLLRVSESNCECGPFPPFDGTKDTCLDLSRRELKRHAGMSSPCWPCQAWVVACQIDGFEGGGKKSGLRDGCKVKLPPGAGKTEHAHLGGHTS